MKDKIYRQLPFLNYQRICPVCQYRIDEKTITNIIIHDARYSKYAATEYTTFYCSICDIPFVNNYLLKGIRRNNSGFMLDMFYTNEKTSLDFIKNKMGVSVVENIQNMLNKAKFYKVIEDNNNQDYIKDIFIRKEKITQCPKCKKELKPGYTRIPINRKQKVEISGVFCHRCKRLYIKNSTKLNSLIKDNQYAIGYNLSGYELHRYTEIIKKEQQYRKEQQYKEKQYREKEQNEKRQQERREKRKKLLSIGSAVFMIILDFEDGSNMECIIIDDKNMSTIENKLYHYTSDEALEFLSAAFCDSREGAGTYRGKTFHVEDVIYPETNTDIRLTEDAETLFESLGIMNSRAYSSTRATDIIPEDIYIMPNGGFDASLIDKNNEIIHLLLFSPFTNRYELIYATHNMAEDYCFVDVSLYRKFVKKYGNPGISLNFNYGVYRGFSKDLNDLNDESILKEYGYSVSQGINLSKNDRQALLAEIIDLEILTDKKVINFLDFFIRTHPSDKYVTARSRWAEDRNFVINYKINPSRFLIAGRL